MIDIRNIGLIGAIELAPIPASRRKRAHAALLQGFERAAGRATGDTIALSPPLIIEKSQIEQIVRHPAAC